PAFVEAHFLVLLLRLRAPVPRARHVASLAGAGILEAHFGHHEGAARRHPARAQRIGEYEPLTVDDFEKDAGLAELLAVRAVHQREELTTDTQVHPHVRHEPRFRTEPLLEQLGFG